MITIAGNPSIHAAESESAPTKRPPSRSTTTASARTSASASGARASQRRAVICRPTGPGRAAATAGAVAAESEVRSRTDTSAAVRSRLRENLLDAALSCAPQEHSEHEQHQPADDEQSEIESRKREASPGDAGCSLTYLIL